MTTTTSHKAYEILSVSFNDLNLEEQIAYGINNWAVEGKSGHIYFGKTEKEALEIARQYNFK
jgi:hypothetical protein